MAGLESSGEGEGHGHLVLPLKNVYISGGENVHVYRSSGFMRSIIIYVLSGGDLLVLFLTLYVG